MKKLFTLVFVISCAGSNYKVQELESYKIVPKGQIGDKTMGLNDKKELILQEEQDASDELRVQEAVNYRWKEDVEYESHMLKWCRTDMSDPRLGGSGIIPPVSEIDNMKTPEDVREEIGINDDGEIKVIRKSYFIDKLKLERRYGKSLQTMLKTIARHREECEYKMNIARRKAGLPGERFSGHFGGPNENTLDDAFRINKERQVRPVVSN
jgi:hypothetical protein